MKHQIGSLRSTVAKRSRDRTTIIDGSRCCTVLPDAAAAVPSRKLDGQQIEMFSSALTAISKALFTVTNVSA